MRHMTRIITILLAAIAAPSTPAMEPLDEVEMAAVSGQDGLAVGLEFQDMTASEVRWEVDQGVMDSTGDLSSALSLENVLMTGVDPGGVNPGQWTSIDTRMDAYGDGAGNGGLGFRTEWGQRNEQGDVERLTRVQTGAISILDNNNVRSDSLGSFVFDSAGSFELYGTAGLFAADRDAAARLIIDDGQWHYRQGNNEFIWNDISVDIGFDQGGINLGNEGLTFDVDRMDWNILFDIGYRNDPANPFQEDESHYYLRYGWGGQLEDFRVEINGGGLAYDEQSEGVNIRWQNNFVGADDPENEFSWIIGSASSAGDEVVLHFRDWVNLPGADFAMDVSELVLDVVNPGQGPQGFAYKGDTVSVDVTDPGLATSFRDVNFLAYNRTVDVFDTGLGDPADPESYQDYPYDTFGWGLIYTLGRLDADIILYPDGGTGNEGLRFDANVGVQSPGAWNQNSHFLISDTDEDVALGFVNTNFLVEINNAHFAMTSGPDGGLSLSTDTDASTYGFRWQLDATFGGGDLADLSDPVVLADMELDLRAQDLDLLFIPPQSPADSYLGFEWSAALEDSSILLAEPGRPDVGFSISEISGQVGVANGRMELASGASFDDGLPRLVFEQDLQIGITAGGDPLRGENFSIGNNTIGEMAIPGGNIYGRLALKEQLP